MQKHQRLSVTPAKMLLFAAAVSIYCVATVVLLSETDALAFSMIIALLPAIGYVAAGGAAIHVADTYQPWPEELKFILGIIWPAVLVFWLTVGTFYHFAQPQEKVS